MRNLEKIPIVNILKDYLVIMGLDLKDVNIWNTEDHLEIGNVTIIKIRKPKGSE